MTARATDIIPPNPSGLCLCGCGGITPIANQSDRSTGRLIGHHIRYIAGHGSRRRAGAHKGRYRFVSLPEHPRADKNGCVYAHVAVAEAAIGHVLPDGVEIHHVDGNGLNNANRNLVICQDRAYHKLLHARQRVISAGGNPNAEKLCSTCRQLLDFSEFNRSTRNKSTGLQSACKACISQRKRAPQRKAA